MNKQCSVIVERIKGTHAPFYRPPLSPKDCEGVHPGILTLMKQCWAEEPNDRPSFDEVAKSLKTVNKGKLVCSYCLMFCVCYSLKPFSFGMCPKLARDSGSVIHS